MRKVTPVVRNLSSNSAVPLSSKENFSTYQHIFSPLINPVFSISKQELDTCYLSITTEQEGNTDYYLRKKVKHLAGSRCLTLSQALVEL